MHVKVSAMSGAMARSVALAAGVAKAQMSAL